MRSLKKLFLTAGSVVRGRRENGVRLLLFHEILPSQLRRFESLIRFIGETHGFIAPGDYDRYRQGDGIRYIVTFDDGFASEFKATRAVLDPLGVKALFFVCPGFVGLQGEAAVQFLRGPMERSDVTEMRPELEPPSWDDLRAMVANGHVIGSHGMNHARLSDVAIVADLAVEVLASGDELEKRLGRSVDWFAYPFGDIASVDSRALEMIGGRYRYCCSGLRGINTGRTHRLGVFRENSEPTASLEDLKRIACGGLDPAYHFQRKKLLRMAESCSG